MLETSNPSANRLFGIIVASTIITCGIGLHFLWPASNNPVADMVPLLLVVALGFMSISFSLGLLISRMSPWIGILLLGFWYLAGLSVISAGMNEGLRSGPENFAAIPGYIGVILLQFVLPYYIGRKISQNRLKSESQVK
ncbi:MAG: hypothetical protein ACYC0V_19900 [Armatimonadota bacterium]